MKNNYELITIFTPAIAEERIQQHLRKIKDIITEHNGEIISEDHWGNKKLAYKIKKQSNGIYNYINFSAETTVINDLKKYFSTNEEIIRYSIVKIDLKPTKAKIQKENVVSKENESLDDVIPAKSQVKEDVRL